MKRPEEIGERVHIDDLDQDGTVVDFHMPVNNNQFPESWSVKLDNGKLIRLWNRGQFEETTP